MTKMVETQLLMDEAAIERVLKRLAHEVLERENGANDIVLVGIHTGGVHLAQRLKKIIEEIESQEIPLGTIDITLYRDDALNGFPRPQIGETHLPFLLEEKKVVLVDDVLFTGRTVRAALDELNDYGRPQRVHLAVLVDRGLRELPIQADYIGIKVDTNSSQRVKVMLKEKTGTTDRVSIFEQERSNMP